jgi:hypothetical protein
MFSSAYDGLSPKLKEALKTSTIIIKSYIEDKNLNIDTI